MLETECYAPMHPGIENRLRDSVDILKNHFPQVKIFTGNATLLELATSLSDWSRSHYLQYANDCLRARSIEDLPSPTTRIETIGLALRNFGLSEQAINSYHPAFHRPAWGLYEYCSPLNLAKGVHDILNGRDLNRGLKKTVMRTRVFTILSEFPDQLLTLTKYVLGEDETVDPLSRSTGMTQLERKETLRTLKEIFATDRPDSTKETLRSLWEKDFEGDKELSDEESKLKSDLEAQIEGADFEDLYAEFTAKLQKVQSLVEGHEARGDNRWGEEALRRWFKALAISHSPSEVLEWAQHQLSNLNRVGNEIGGRLVSGSQSWQEAWQGLPDQNIPIGVLLEQYQKEIPQMIGTMVAKGMIPPIPQNCSYEVELATPEQTHKYPKGFMRFAPYHEKQKVVRIYLPNPLGFDEEARPGVMKELVMGKGVFAAHEVASHALAQYYKTRVPESVTMVGPTITLGLEGHAFTSELRAFEEEIMPQNLLEFFMVVRNRIQRAARVVFELKYHLKLNDDIDALIDEFSHNMGVARDFVVADANRGMSHPGELFSYYLGASGVERYLTLAEKAGVGRKDAMLHYLESSGAHLAPHMQAYLDGLVDRFENLNWLTNDRAVTLWRQYKDIL